METLNDKEILEMIHRGGVFDNVDGSSLFDVFKNVCKLINLPSYLSPEEVYKGLCTREELLSTAVGYGISIPHSANCLIKEANQQEICIVYLKHPLSINTPDRKPVSTLFIVLTMNSDFHMKTLEALSRLFRNIHFRNAINNKVSEAVLAAIINNLA